MFRNNHGIGLVQALMITGVVAIMAVGTTALVTKNTKSQKLTQSKLREKSLVEEIRTVLKNPLACQKTFSNFSVKNLNQHSRTIQNILDKNGEPLYQVGETDSENLLGFNKFAISSAEEFPETYASKKIQLTVQLVSQLRIPGTNFRIPVGGDNGVTAAIDGFKLKPQVINIQASANNYLVSNCFALDSNMGEGSLWSEANNSGAGQVLYKDNIGVKSSRPNTAVDVNGEVKFGYSGVTCDADHMGQQRHHPGTGKMEYCNGTDWLPYAKEMATDCVGFFTLCNSSNKKYYVIAIPATGNGANCIHNGGYEESCVIGGGTVSVNYTCPTGWSLSGGSNCTKTATMVINEDASFFAALWDDGFRCNPRPCTSVGQNVSCICSGHHSWCRFSPYEMGYAFTCSGSVSCPSGSTASGSNCVMPATEECPPEHPVNQGNGTCGDS